VEVDVRNGHAGDFGEAHPGINQQAEERRVAPLLEARAFAGFEEILELLIGKDGDGDFGRLHPAHPLHGVAGNLGFLREPGKEPLQAAVGGGRGVGGAGVDKSAI
jgi:hypothetical protein